MWSVRSTRMNDLRIVTALPQSLRPAYEALLASAGLRDGK